MPGLKTKHNKLKPGEWGQLAIFLIDEVFFSPPTKNPKKMEMVSFFLSTQKKIEGKDLPEKLRWMSQNLGGFWIFHLKDWIWTLQWKGKNLVGYLGQLFFFLLFTNRVEKNIRNPRLFFVDVRKCQCDFGPTCDISGAPGAPACQRP